MFPVCKRHVQKLKVQSHLANNQCPGDAALVSFFLLNIEIGTWALLREFSASMGKRRRSRQREIELGSKTSQFVHWA